MVAEQKTSVESRIKQYAKMVRAIAWEVRKGLPKHVDYEELIADGMVGLWNAAMSFDPDKGASFSTYAKRRVWGEMMDGLRHRDWGPRFHDRSMPGVVVRSFSASEALRRTLAVRQAATDDVGAEVEQKEDLGRFLFGMSGDQRTAFTLYYGSDCTMREIGMAIGISESRVSQIMSDGMIVARRNAIREGVAR